MIDEVNKNLGDIKISDDVVASIAGLAACEVDGVASMEGNITSDIVRRLGIRNSSKGIKIEINDGIISIDIYVNLKYGFSIPTVTAQVQERVKSAVESMTGLKTSAINIHIVGIDVK